ATSSQLPVRATAATLSRPMTNITRDRFAITAVPAQPGASRANASISCGIWSGRLASTCETAMLIAAITAVPSHDMSRIARVDPALVWSKAGPSRADKTGNALVTMDMVRTEETEGNT